MASVSSPGIGSGLDVTNIVTQLMNAERTPLRLLQSKATGIETKISSFGQIKSAMAALYDTAQALAKVDTWRVKTASSSDETIAKATASSDVAAATFALQVNSLAQQQSVASSPVSSGSGIGSDGVLQIQIGKWSEDNLSFAGQGSSIDVQIASTDSMTAIAAKVNAANAGVSAVVVKGTAGDQLLFRSTKTGEENGFSLSVSTPGLNALAYEPGTVAANSGASLTQQAQDAKFTINGIASNSATNTASDVVNGLSIELKKVSSSPVEITVNNDTQHIKDKVEAFQTAYNKINSVIANLTKYDQASKTSNPLQGDSTAVSLQNTLRRIIGTPNGDGVFLSNLGLELQRDGSLSTNSTKLDQALTDLPKLQEAMTGTGGVITRLRDFAFQANGVEGSITARNNALQSYLSNNGKEQDRMSMLLDKREVNLLKQYQALDGISAQWNSLSSLVSGLNKKSD